MDKPMSLVIEETKATLANTVNNSQLPLYILDSIFKDLYNEIHILSVQQSQKEIEAYNMELKKQEESKKKETENKDNK